MKSSAQKSRKIKLATFVLFGVLSLVFAGSLLLKSAYAVEPAYLAVTTTSDFNLGTYSSTQANSTGDGAVSLSVGGYKRQLTFNNAGGALTDYQVLIDEGEVGYWKMDEASGTAVADASGLGNTGSAVSTTIVAGKWGNSRAFSGAGRYVNVTNNWAKFNHTDSFTVSTWAYKNAANPYYAGIFVQQATTSGYFNYSLQEDNAGNICANVGRYSVVGYSTCYPMPMNAWTHVAMTYSGNTATLYVDGVSRGTATYPGTVTSAPNGSAYIGNDSAATASRYWNGMVDEVRVYNRAFTSSEISYLFSNNLSPLLGSVYSHAQESGNDLRFKDSDDSTSLNYWVENFSSAGQNAKLWVKVPSIGASTTKNIYMYYGGGGSAQSSGVNTFMFFDDATGTLGSKWGTTSGTVGYGLYNGKQSIRVNGWLASVASYSGNFSMEADVYGSSNTVSHLVAYTTSNISGGYSGRTDTRAVYPASWGETCLFKRSTWACMVATGKNTTGNVWHKVKFTGVANTFNLYVDGALITTASDSDTTSGLWGLHSELSYTYFANVKVRSLVSSDPALTTVGSEATIYATSGVWTSASNSNAIDLRWNGGWGDGTPSSVAFTAVVSNVTVGHTDVSFRVRSADTLGNLVGATYVNIPVTGGANPYTITASDMPAIVNGGRYVQIEAAFTQDNATTAVLESIRLDYLRDNTEPSSVSNLHIFKTGSFTSPLTGDNWTNDLAPKFTWTAATDPNNQSGVAGYCLYLGQTSQTDPVSSKGLLGTSSYTLPGNPCLFIVQNNEVDFATEALRGSTWLTLSNDPYYLVIKAVDHAGNVHNSDMQEIAFGYDSQVPNNVMSISSPGGNFANVADMSFSWPLFGSGASAATDDHSNVLGYQYQINSTSGTWKGITHSDSLNIDYISTAETTYQLTQVTDGASIVLGDNTVYFRTIDNAGNISTSQTYRTANLAYGGAAPTFEPGAVVTVSPSETDTNLFSLSWPEAQPAVGNTIAGYYYMVNAPPPNSKTTLEGNVTAYTPVGINTTVSATVLRNVNKGSNVVYVVAVDNEGHYSPSNKIQGAFMLNSTNPDPVQNLSATDASVKEISLWRASLAWEVPEYRGTDTLTYIVQRSENGTVWTEVTRTSGTSYVDTVSSSQQYYWRIGTIDTSAESQADPSFTNGVTLTPKGKYLSAPSLVTGPNVKDIGTMSATIYWSTDRTSNSTVSYGISSGNYNPVGASVDTQETSHDVPLTNLKYATTYYYIVTWTDEDGNTGTSLEKTFTTEQPPQVLDVRETEVALYTATVTFKVKGAKKVDLHYGKSTSYGAVQSVNTSSEESTYTVRLSGLDDGTAYHYKLMLTDAEGNSFPTLEDHIFETLPSPHVSNIQMQQVRNTAESTVQVSWESNTEVTSIIAYYPGEDTSQEQAKIDLKLVKGEHKMTITSLNPDTTYSMRVKGRDRLGNEAVSDVYRFTTSSDSRPPMISNLAADSEISQLSDSGDSGIQLVVSWTTDEPATSQVEYGEGAGSVYNSKTFEDASLTTDHIVVLNNLDASKVYHLRVNSKDKAGNNTTSYDVVTVTAKRSDSAIELIFNNLRSLFNL